MASHGKRFAVGCGAILLLMIFAGWAGCHWFSSRYGWTLDHTEIRSRATEIIPVAIPSEYEPYFSVYTNDDENQRDPIVFFRFEEGRGVESLLFLHEQKESFSAAEAFNRMNNARSGMRPVTLSDVTREEWTISFQGEEQLVVLEQGLDPDEALRRRIAVVVPWQDHYALLLAEGPPNAVPRDLMSTLLNSL